MNNKFYKNIFPLALSILLSCSLVACGEVNSQAGGTSQAMNLATSPTEAVNKSEVSTVSSTTQTDVVQRETPKEPVSYSIYEPFGLHYDKDKNELTFENELVRYFYDGVTLTDVVESVYCDYLNEKGTVDIHTVRKTINNKDGSVDPFGELTGIERYSQKEFDNRDLSNFYGSSDAVTYVSGTDDPLGKTFVERFEPYKDFGIKYVEAKSGSGAGNVYFNGQLVRAFVDVNPKGGAFSFNSADGGEIAVQTTYDKNGKLTGVEKIN